MLAMLSNFRKMYIDPFFYPSPPQQEQQSLLSCISEPQDDPSDIHSSDQMNDAVAQQHWAFAMAETVFVPGCACPFCRRHSEIDVDADTGATPTTSHPRNSPHPSLPDARGIVQALYPPSYLGTPRPFPDPPSYSLSDSSPYSARGDDAQISTITSIEGTPLSRSRLDPLSEDPSLTGVPSQWTPPSCIVEPSFPVITQLDAGDVCEEIEPLPAYSRFDQRRPRFPAASDVLGPYPPLPVLCPAAP